MPYITVGANPGKINWAAMLWFLGQMVKNALLPTWLGGVNRKCVNASGSANLYDTERLVRMFVDGKLSVPIDSTWAFEDALKVSDYHGSN